MYPPAQRLSRVRHLGTATAVLGIVAGVVLIVLGIPGVAQVAGFWSIVAGGVLIGGGVLVLVLMRLALKIESNTSRLYGEARELHEAVRRLGQSLAMIAENTSISDAAKSITNRTKEREMLRASIFDEVHREDFDGAFHLIEELESRLGFREEAERLREEIREACTDAFREKTRDAIQHINRLFDEYRWDQAEREITRMEPLIPSEQRIKTLRNRLVEKREERKQQLLQEWNAAADDGNVELGLEMLGELDHYLSRDEAASLASTAREMFKERLQQLGVQFQFAVKEKRWRDALATGLQIIEEFPNARMAQEISDRLGPLRERAGIPVDVDVTARTDKVAGPTDATAG